MSTKHMRPKPLKKKGSITLKDARRAVKVVRQEKASTTKSEA